MGLGPMRAPEDVNAAKPILLTGMWITGILGVLCIAGGVVAIVWNAQSPTTVKLFGANLTTGHIGVAFVFIGVVTASLAVRSAFKRTAELAKLPKLRP